MLGPVSIDLSAAADFMATHARPVDRRRFESVTGRPGARVDPGALVAAVNGYRNPDGGYGWGLEPDLRSSSSQPAAALHAFEAVADIAPATAPESAALCDWLASVTLPDGGLPFALPIDDPAGCAPFWAQADPAASSLQITAIVAAMAHRVAAHDPAVAAHPWLAGATRYCLAAIGALAAQPHALELAFAVRLLDAVIFRDGAGARPEAQELLTALAGHIPADGLVHVAGGLDDEFMRPLDFAPDPDRPARRFFTPEVISAELDRLAGQQRDDGGWAVDFASYSPSAALEWRGHATVKAISILRDHGRLEPGPGIRPG
jgi:hypothetical protein